MIQERYCSYEVAKLLKEKGFDEPCRAVYEEKILRINTLCDYFNSELSSYVCAPTHQMAMDYLEEEKNIIINVEYNGGDSWFFNFYHNGNFYFIDDAFNSRGEAVEAGLNYCLTELIK